MNRVNVDENEFDNFLTKKSRLKYAEKRADKGKKPFLGIGSKQLKLKNEGLLDESSSEGLDVQAMAKNLGIDAPDPNPNQLSDVEELLLAQQGGTDPTTTTTEAGFFAKNKTALMIGGVVLLLGGAFFVLKKRGIIGG
tara:strand:- start:96 stop:509 length:414 start_codon:yes stop_codon:yes gene_type:complete